MLAFIGLIVLLQFLGPGPLDVGALLRVCVYGGLGYVCPAAVIPVGVCWFSGWLIREVYRDRKVKAAQAKRILRPAPAIAGCPPTKPPTAAAETTRQRVNRLFWGYAVLVALCMIFALTLQHAP